MIRVENLSFGFGAEALYSKVSFSVVDGQKVGLVGPNGSGKSTLFKLLTGGELAEEGKIEIDGKVVFVPQEIKFDEILDNSKSIKEYLDPQGTAADYYLKSLLAGLEMSQVSLEQIPTTLSGGQKTRLAIARAMVLEPDILLLDEPTNFLDTSGKKWVMQMLAYYPKTVMVISHDLKLLDKNITKVLAVNTQTKTIDVYSGNYSQFIKLKSEKDELLKRQIAVQQKHLIQMKKGWLKMAHVKSEKGVRQRINLEKRMAKIEENMPEMPQEAKKIRMILPEPAWCGTLPLWAKNISKSFGDKKILTNVTLDIHRGERIALMGQNGAGKSTLIKILMGIVPADSGEVIRDDKLKIGYYNQELEQFNREGTLVAAMKEKCVMGEQAIRSILGRFLFGGDKVWQKVGLLSGGEKTRLAIAQLLAQNFNLLILDEPTTYLDGLSQRLILEAIKEYKGAILIVSHTPEFIDELKVSRKLYLPENRIEICSR